MLAFTTLKSFLYLKFLKISTCISLPHAYEKWFTRFTFSSLLFSWNEPSAVDPFTLSLPFALTLVRHFSFSPFSHFCLLSNSLSLSLALSFIVSFFLTRHLVQTHFEARKLSIDATVPSICLDSLDLSQKNSFNNISLFFFFFYLFNPRVPFFIYTRFLILFEIRWFFFFKQ